MFSDKTNQRLQTEIIMWMTTVTPHGQPQTSPVWFLWDGQEILIWSLDPTPRLANLRTNDKVALNLDGNGTGGDIVTIEGVAVIDPDGPAAHEVPEYVKRYQDRMDKGWGGPAQFAAKYPTLVRVAPTRVRQ